MKLLILVSLIGLAKSVPLQPKPLEHDPPVEIEKQEIRELPQPEQKSLIQDTADEERKRHQSTKDILEKIREVNRQHGLTPKGVRSNQDYVEIPFPQRTGATKQQNFQFPQSPFSNPIFDYLRAEDQGDKSRQTNTQPIYSAVNTNAAVAPEDQIPGQYIKRKITHHQTFIAPSLNGMLDYNQFMQNPFPQQFVNQQPQDQAQSDKLKQTLENRTVENVRKIVNNQLPTPIAFNPYTYGQVIYSYPYFNGEYQQQAGGSRPNRQWQWPLAQYFPIVIKDPFQQIFNAFTSMVEYGQSNDALCAGGDQSKSRSGKTINFDDIQADPLGMDIEDIELTDDQRNPMKLTFNFETENDAKRSIENDENEESKRLNNKFPQFTTTQIKNQQTKTSIKKVASEATKERDEVSHDNNLKLFSKDNTGSGILIHRMKVRKGGVAIAGPGGIATAGSGGTAIVGPNGYAFTQPGGIAIAGAGSKVVAVDPAVNLTELVDNLKNGGTGPRIGKVVAVGPVVYHNNG